MSETAEDDSPWGPGYPKIDTCFRRDKNNVIIPWDWTYPTYRYLENNAFDWTEKVDGTNIRLHWVPGTDRVVIGGRTDRAQLPGPLVAALEAQQIHNDWVSILNKRFPETEYPVTFYGEGYGAGIQKGGGYSSTQHLIIFDCLQGHRWLDRPELFWAANELGLETVPSLYQGASPRSVCAAIRDGEVPSHWPGVIIEGLVGHPSVPIRDRFGRRISLKIKTCDWAKWKVQA